MIEDDEEQMKEELKEAFRYVNDSTDTWVKRDILVGQERYYTWKGRDRLHVVGEGYYTSRGRVITRGGGRILHVVWDITCSGGMILHVAREGYYMWQGRFMKFA